MNLFLVIGFVGQTFFSLRFLVQWIASEKQGKSVIPLSFWIFSILGSSLLLIYAIYRKDPVFILGQAPNIFIYSRNLYLIKKERNQKKENDNG
ncbi:MAG: lipid-A-disaccharide synthase N-terminal domain-containing protein [Psychrilyobacter sp.]|uniref:lipid-A-disaccharide synthase N-terminal domain-containing protein n=1 Tax=Psychrilyobacter sp. TaxID=2586924 RepID=UPI003C75D4EE